MSQSLIYTPVLTQEISKYNNSTTNIGGRTTLSANITTTNETLITVSNASGIFSAGQTIKINSEYMIIISIATNDLTVSRGDFGSTASTHNSGDIVTGAYVGTYELNRQVDCMVSLKSGISGTEYFDFSNDAINDDTFPVTGFNVSPNIHEFHTAVKGQRYFRIRFDVDRSDTSELSEATFRVYTYFGNYRLGNLPLNQSISEDADSIVVRSVGIGQEPDNTYSNIKKDGTAFVTTNNLQGTTLQQNINDTEIGNITVGDTTNFPSSGYVVIENEIVEYDIIVDSTTLNIIQRGVFGCTPISHNSGVHLGEVYNSGILDLRGYTQFQAQYRCDKSAHILFIWYADNAGSTIIRRLTPDYPSDTVIGDFDFNSGPSFGPYVRFVWGNTNTTATTFLYFEAIFLTKSISPQVLTLNSKLTSETSASVVRSINVGQQPDGDFVNSKADGTAITTETPLLANGEYVSDWVDVDGWNNAKLFVYSDVPSAFNGVIIEYTNDTSDIVPIISDTLYFTFNTNFVNKGGITFNIPIRLDGFRIRYINNGTEQTVFFLNVTMRVLPDSNSYNSGGSLLISNFEAEVALENVPNYSFITRMGRRADIDTNTDPAVAWSGPTQTYLGMPTNETPVAIEVLSSSGNDTALGTGARTIEIYGLKTNTSIEYEKEIITLTGIVPSSSSFTWYRINYAVVITSGTGGINAGNITIRNSAITSNIYAYIPATFGITQMAIYTVPYKHRINIREIRLNITRASGAAGSARIDLVTRNYEAGALANKPFILTETYDITTGNYIKDNRNGGII
jgi:hypothetical protein